MDRQGQENNIVQNRRAILRGGRPREATHQSERKSGAGPCAPSSHALTPARASLSQVYTARRRRNRRRATAVLAPGWDAMARNRRAATMPEPWRYKTGRHCNQNRSPRRKAADFLEFESRRYRLEVNRNAGKERRYSGCANRTPCHHDFVPL